MNSTATLMPGMPGALPDLWSHGASRGRSSIIDAHFKGIMGKDNVRSPSVEEDEEAQQEVPPSSPASGAKAVGPMTLVRQASSRNLLARGLPRTPTYRDITAAERIPQAIYLGIELEIMSVADRVLYGVSMHDGSWSLDYYDQELDVAHCETIKQKIEFFEDHIISNVKEYQVAYNYKVHVIGLGLRICGETCVDYGPERRDSLYGTDAPSLSSRLWLELDALPYVIKATGVYMDERASSAARQAVIGLSPQYPNNIPRVQIGYRNRVEVDGDGMINLIDLRHYKDTCSDSTWLAMLSLAHEIRERGLRVSYFNSTPQGGGVAIMRHALIRLCQRLGVNVKWYVTTPSPEVFNVTKRKFHNVLQGVAPPETRLTEEDKRRWLAWIERNVSRHFSGPDGPIEQSDVIVIDDPQVSGLIPWIRKINPECRIVYRSHIEIRADLIRNDPNGAQAETWDFLWSAIKQADLFVSHPVENFVPDCVPRDHVVMIPACTDMLDGLNKPLSEWDTVYYQEVFNRLCFDQGSRKVDWSRPYITQIARFDPSKGIPDVLHAFKILHLQFQQEGWLATDPQLPQLVICGHGSVDDPDGTWVFEQAHGIIHSPEYSYVRDFITIVRIPPCDQLLNVALRGATTALQLSHREGFEIKVTEAIAKGVPVVAYRTGGIPFQIEDGKNGYLVDVGDTRAVARCLYKLCTDEDLHRRMSEYAKANVSEEYFTAFQFVNWAYVWVKLKDTPCDAEGALHESEHCMQPDGSEAVCYPKLKKKKHVSDVLGNGAWVRDLWRDELVAGNNRGLPAIHNSKHHDEAHRSETWEKKAGLRGLLANIKLT